MTGYARLHAMLIISLAAFTIACLHNPPYELHVAIHVVPTWLAIILFSGSVRWFPLSSLSFCGIVCFLVLHVIGTRYVYSFVPYEQWIGQILNFDMSGSAAERNHYDRFVHFSYGVLIVPFVRETYQRLAGIELAWSCFFAVEFVLASSMLFELLEWIGAVRLAPEFADSYLGQQGDMWDAHKDMGLAFVGATLSAITIGLLYRCRAQ